jgi:DAK2 domain fusion protein YloV
MTPTEGTILTVAREAVEYAVAQINDESTIRTLFSDIVKEMYASLQRTPEILTVLKEAGVVDSGGAGLFYIMDGFYRVLNGEEISSSAPAKQEGKPTVDLSAFGPDSEMTYGYCTELLLQLQNSKVDMSTFDYRVIPDFLATIGDSIVAFQTDTIVKIHVHTKTPERVLEFCRQFGEFLTVKIENMSLQHNESEDMKKKAPAPAKKEHKKYALVSVCNGDGVKEIFRELGADVIVDGGQTQNPSTSDFLEAFDTLDAEHIYVFPNNGNIIMAASQAAQIYEKAKVHVIETKNLGAGYVALTAMNPDESDPDALAEAFREAISGVATGYISPSIRDAELNGIHISNGDFIGFVNKEMLISEPDKITAAKGLADKMLSCGDKYIFTVFSGIDASDEEKSALEEYVTQSYSDVEVYFLEGGQDIYPFIFVAE